MAAKAPVPRIYSSFEGNKNGKCTILYSDGIRSAYKGECINKVPNGKGRILLANTAVYEGDFKDGRACGPGSLTIDQVIFTCSTFDDMVPNGKCAVTYPNRTKKLHVIHSQAEVDALVRDFGTPIPPAFKELLKSLTNNTDAIPHLLPISAAVNRRTRSRPRSHSHSRPQSQLQSQSRSRSQPATRRKLHSWNNKPHFKYFNL